MQPVTSEEESDQSLAVSASARRGLVMFAHAQVPSHVCIYVCVHVSVAVYRTHVELQTTGTHLCICTYRILKGLAQCLQSTVPIFSENARENIFNIYTWNRF